MEIKKYISLKNTFLGIIFLIQINYILQIGLTYDIGGLRYGAGLSIKRGLNFLNLTEFNLPIFNEAEYFGMILLIPAYLFGHSSNIIIGDFLMKTNFFFNEDQIIFSFMFIFLNIYLIFCFNLIFNFFKVKFSKEFAWVFLVFLFLFPSFMGQALFNIKDTPFCLQIFISTIYYLNFIEKLAHQEKYETSEFKKDIIKIIILFSSVLLIRLNGIVFLLFLCLFGLLYLLKSKLDTVGFFKINFIIFIFSFINLFLFSPSSWSNPIIWLTNTFKHQFFHRWPGTTLTNGRFVSAQDVDPFYLLEWSFYRFPIIFQLLFILFIYFKIKNFKNTLFYNYSIYFIFTIHLSFIIFRPTAYDGLRQYIFLIPFLVFVCVENLIQLEKIFNKKNILLFFSIVYLITSQVSLGPYRYLYFNEFVDEKNISIDCINSIDGCGDWLTDYSGISGKRLIYNFDFGEESTNLLVCRPEHVFEKYVENENVNVFWSNNINSFDTFFVSTLHWPRNTGDSCNFHLEEEKYNCNVVYKETAKLRFSEITLSYMNICNN